MILFLSYVLLINLFYTSYSVKTTFKEKSLSRVSTDTVSLSQIQNKANANNNAEKAVLSSKSQIKNSNKHGFKALTKEQSFFRNSNKSNTKIKSSLNLNKKSLSSSKSTEPTLPEGFVSWYEGWVHYYKYNNDTDIERPRNFFVNKKYWDQRKKSEEVAYTDKFGMKIIPDRNSFYIVLGEKSFNIYDSRDDPVLSQVDHLDYEYIAPIPTDKKYSGGVADMFKFSFGSCIMIKANIVLEASSQSTPQRWIFCLNKDEDKNKLLNALIKAKLYIQSLSGEIVSSDSLNSSNSSNDVSSYLGTKRKSTEDEDIKKDTQAVDGYWVTLQDWTECNLKCGGGESFKHRMCVPPKNGGRPCTGEAVETQSCNVQACPEAKSYVEQKEVTKPVISNPIVKIGSFSQRPQRYTKCVLKENDCFTSQNKESEDRFPSRIVMNTKTISLFKSDNYQEVIATFELSETDFSITSGTNCCFNLLDKTKSKVICGYDKDCGSTETNEWATKWKEDFNLFKTQCYQGTEESLLSNDDEALLNKKAQDKLKQANLDIAKAKQYNVKEELLNDQKSTLENNIVETQKTGFEAIEKELDIENMLKEEEKQKEADDIKRLQDKLSSEAQKLKCVKESIQEKELDTEYIAQKHQVESDINSIKKEFAQKITKKREKLKNLLEQMRKKSSMEKSKLESEIKTLRNKISADIMSSQKNGSIETCREGKINKDKRDNYCNTNFVDDFVNNGDCKLDEEFCYLCCETEFGNNYIDKRENCYKMCDLKEEVTETAPGDHWSWVPK